jgi:hypothetical protein
VKVRGAEEDLAMKRRVYRELIRQASDLTRGAAAGARRGDGACLYMRRGAESQSVIALTLPDPRSRISGNLERMIHDPPASLCLSACAGPWPRLFLDGVGGHPLMALHARAAPADSRTACCHTPPELPFGLGTRLPVLAPQPRRPCAQKCAGRDSRQHGLQDASAIIPHQMTSARGAERCLALSQAAARKWENDTWSASHFSDWSKLWHHVHPFFRPSEPLGCDLICDNTWTRDAALPDPPNTRPLCVPLLLALHFCYPPLRARTDESFSASFVFIFPIPCKSSALALMVCDICSSASPRQGSCS